jgi:hypothetical protein
MISGGASKISDAENTLGPDGKLLCPNRSCPNGNDPKQKAVIDQGNEGRNQETIGGVLVGVGVAAIGTGLILYFTSSPSSTAQAPSTFSVAKNTSLTPAVSPSFTGLSLAGHF